MFAPRRILTAQEIVDAAYARIMNDEAFIKNMQRVWSDLMIYGRAEWSFAELPGLLLPAADQSAQG